MNIKKIAFFTTTITLSAVLCGQALAAIALDRTRVIYNGAEKTISLNIKNENTELPYLAQGWIEDANGNKIESPLTVLPPVQRVEPGEGSQVKIQSLPDIATLPQDRESVYYFNLREIPPRSKEANVLQIALQTRIKLFYRPKALYATRTDLENPWQEKITLTRKGDAYEVTNPTAYFVTIVDASSKVGGDTVKQFEPVMISPKGNGMLKGSASAMGAKPVLTYINDYGGRPKLTFGCAGTTCKVESSTDR
ncbi:fimbria/pilus periplasmic chaperone [Providencia huaxiensis]|uniref:Fimbria/pilus periplasmic chaperone n=1 Tax=Providencia huaxiensis TaxID=2027290 RepID=A0A345M0L5_9GAMM|nr:MULTISPECIES: fimbria/pilus periplasmic chaperone [Providencia]MBZ3679969.1 fimbria/pilus periplasmic chaperone [Providencia rettgeri]AXH63905.1 fimbria/pilus periplasmic chaperone [Providencia huaxiensis]MBN6363061.1 fimbria/pilus periplasmic chaperone [Providencia huaxiensis]MBQ0268104.1 fimbria/pilus periplasmic chaperone [Providencia huaxiensis]MBQ0532774.1 fimbria/pilus periplasmic chaperone [Providencia huaxiensis]